MKEKKSEEGLNVKKNENFSEWFTQVTEKAEILDIRLGIKGFVIMRPWGALTMENMFKHFETELQKNGHKPTFMPSVIPKENLTKESEHIQGFTPQVFWLKDINEGQELALRPTSETVYTPMFKLWVRSWRDLPMKLYQRAHVFRLDTKATRPLIRGREFIWIECHDAFKSKEDAEKQVQEDIEVTEKVMHQTFGVPFLPMKRPEWDKFAGAEYTVGSDCFMPDGKLIQQPSTHLMGQKFSKAFGAEFENEKGKKEFLWTTTYGPAISRILVSIITTHGDDSGLVFPYSVSPTQVVIVPIFTTKNKKKVLKKAEEIFSKLNKLGVKVELDSDSEKRPGEKYHYWELKGVPFRIEFGEKELEKKELTFFERDTREKIKIKIADLKKIPDLGKEFDKRLLENADKMFKEKIAFGKTEKDVKKILDEGKVAKVDFCSTDKNGLKCAQIVEKNLGAEVRGTLANTNEKARGNCPFCGKHAKKVVYIGRSY